MNQLRKLRKNKEENKKQFNRIKSATLKLCLLLLNFIFATFAWFTYTRLIQVDVNVNVSAWEIDFKDENDSLGNEIQFQVKNLYPGMEDFTKKIDIQNLGDRDAEITYDISNLKILGKEYILKDEPADGDSENTLYKTETIEDGVTVVKLLNSQDKIPFEITLSYSSIIYSPKNPESGSNTGYFQVVANWPYIVTENDVESQERNELDTLWGYNIANFYKLLPEGDESQALEVTLNVTARQIIK